MQVHFNVVTSSADTARRSRTSTADCSGSRPRFRLRISVEYTSFQINKLKRIFTYQIFQMLWPQTQKLILHESSHPSRTGVIDRFEMSVIRVSLHSATY